MGFLHIRHCIKYFIFYSALTTTCEVGVVTFFFVVYEESSVGLSNLPPNCPL